MFLKAARELLPDDVEYAIYDGLRAVPPFDSDLMADGFPPEVERLRHLASEADAFVMATPEYNRSFSGVLKNALDWLSMQPDPPLAGKPVLVTGVAPGALGAALATYQLRQPLIAQGMHVVPGAEIHVFQAKAKFSETGALIDDMTRDRLRESLNNLIDMALRLRK